MDDTSEPKRRRGTVVLVITLIVVSGFAVVQSIPRAYDSEDLRVRVAVIDSGINVDRELESRVVASRSFINVTFGYAYTDNSTTDSMPSGTTHGTYIARIISRNAPNAAIVNAKVVAEDDTASIRGIIEAIYWAVEEQNCSVINLSLGMGEVYSGDAVGDAVRWAFERGVVVVAAAGNDGQGGVSTSSIESPALYPEVIAVAAIDDLYAPYSFTALGPMSDRTVKPDIAASGKFSDNGRTVFGTSFAAPLVAAGAVTIIAHCTEKDWKWTPGMVKAALMAGALKIPVEEWKIGVGVLDVEGALGFVDFAKRDNGLPLVVAISPLAGPFSFERWFVNHTSTVKISVFSSSEVTFSLSYRGTASQWVHGPSSVTLNQTGWFSVDVNVVSSAALEDLAASVTLAAYNYSAVKTEISFDVIVPLKEVAFDFTHTGWPMDSIYGQFRYLYRTLTKSGIAVEELRGEAITLATLSRYDAVYVLDSCARAYVMDNYTVGPVDLFSYSSYELEAYYQYWANGGSLLLVGMSNSSINQKEANALFSMFNVTLNDDHVPAITIVVNGVPSTEEVYQLADHPTTRWIDTIDYNGCSLNVTGDTIELAWAQVFWRDDQGNLQSETRALIAGLETPSGSRLLATGSNFWMDNWALNDRYHSTENIKLVLQTTFWLLHML
jgi:subtilisin family serine protease